MTGVEVVTATSSTDCCSCSAESNKANECCSLWKLFSFCRRKHRAGELFICESQELDESLFPATFAYSHCKDGPTSFSGQAQLTT